MRLHLNYPEFYGENTHPITTQHEISVRCLPQLGTECAKCVFGEITDVSIVSGFSRRIESGHPCSARFEAPAPEGSDFRAKSPKIRTFRRRCLKVGRAWVPTFNAVRKCPNNCRLFSTFVFECSDAYGDSSHRWGQFIPLRG